MSKKNLIQFAMTETFEKNAKIECEKHRIASERYTNYNANFNDELTITFLGYAEAEKGYDYSYKNFPFYRIVYTLSGQAKLTYPDKEYILKSGSICGMPPKDTGLMSVDSSVPWAHYFLHFLGTEAEKLFNKTMLSKRKVAYISNPPKYTQYFENIVEEERNNLEFSNLINVNLLKILLLKLANDSYNLEQDHSLASRETYLICREYINKSFSQINNFDQLAEDCSISKSYLCRIFKQYAEISPMTYVTNLKMNKATVLLMQSDMSIKQISRSLGFEDQYYFSKLFKKKYGISPKFFRKKFI